MIDSSTVCEAIDLFIDAYLNHDERGVCEAEAVLGSAKRLGKIHSTVVNSHTALRDDARIRAQAARSIAQAAEYENQAMMYDRLLFAL